MWKRRFSVLGPDSRIRLNVDTTMSIIVACAVLHNFIRRRYSSDDVVITEESFMRDELEDSASFSSGFVTLSAEGVDFRRSVINSHFRDQ